jgi:hypothetical protein
LHRIARKRCPLEFRRVNLIPSLRDVFEVAAGVESRLLVWYRQGGKLSLSFALPALVIGLAEVPVSLGVCGRETSDEFNVLLAILDGKLYPFQEIWFFIRTRHIHRL